MVTLNFEMSEPAQDMENFYKETFMSDIVIDMIDHVDYR